MLMNERVWVCIKVRCRGKHARICIKMEYWNVLSVHKPGMERSSSEEERERLGGIEKV